MPKSDKIQEILHHFHRISHWQIHYFRDGAYMFSTNVSGETSAYLPENPFICDPFLFSKILNGQTGPVYFRTEEEEQDIYYGVLQIEEKEYCIVGPLARFPLTRQQVHCYMKQHHMHDFVNYSIRVSPEKEIESFLILISVILCGEARQPETTDDEDRLLEPDGIQEFKQQSYRFDNSEKLLQHVPYSLERKFLSCIQNADMEGMKHFYSNASDYTDGIMSHSILKQEEYAAVVGISLMSRAAIEGGLNPYDAYDLNDLYLQKVSNAKSIKEYKGITAEAARGYILAVAKAKAVQSQSVHIERCKTYIYSHLHIPFSLKELAEHIGLTPTYLSSLFREFEHMTIKEYTLRERVHAAENMLKFSEFSISQIAAYLCFHSQSHFGAVFKRYTGTSPSAYRKRNRQIEI